MATRHETEAMGRARGYAASGGQSLNEPLEPEERAAVDEDGRPTMGTHGGPTAQSTRAGTESRSYDAREVVRVEGRIRPTTMARVQGVFYVVSGAWPLVHMPSFEAVTGKKH